MGSGHDGAHGRLGERRAAEPRVEDHAGRVHDTREGELARVVDLVAQESHQLDVGGRGAIDVPVLDPLAELRDHPPRRRAQCGPRNVGELAAALREREQLVDLGSARSAPRPRSWAWPCREDIRSAPRDSRRVLARFRRRRPQNLGVTPSHSARRLFLVDGTALAYRSHFALARVGLTNAAGQPTAADLRLHQHTPLAPREGEARFVGGGVRCGGETERHRELPTYKATREKAPEEMVAQFPWIERIAEAYGAFVVKRDGVEADDLLATFAVRGAKEGLDVFLVTGTRTSPSWWVRA